MSNNLIKAYAALSSIGGSLLFSLDLPEDPSFKQVSISVIGGSLYGIGIIPVLPFVPYLLVRSRKK